LVLLLASAGTYGLWRAFQPGTGLTPEGFALLLSEAAESSGDDPNVGAIVRISTNLPDETQVIVEHEQLGGPSAGHGPQQCCPRVNESFLLVTVDNLDCLNAPPGTVPSSGFRLKLTVVPDTVPVQFQCLNCEGLSNPQPKRVQEVLGPNFERVTGDQVTTVAGMRALVATGTFQWPEDTCAAALRAADRMPEVCRPGTEGVSEEDVGAVGRSVVGTLVQFRLCELWNYGTEEFRSTHPWPEFRDGVRAWLDGLGPLVEPGWPARGREYLSAHVVRESQQTIAGTDGKQLP
jgi:hypothetical protein